MIFKSSGKIPFSIDRSHDISEVRISAKTLFKNIKTDVIITGTFVNFQREGSIF